MIDPGQLQALGTAAAAADKALGRFPLVAAALDQGLAAILHFGGVDWLVAQQTVTAASIKAKMDQKLAAIPENRRTEASAAVVLPLLEEALNENRDELQDLWAALLANTMVDGGRRVRREYFAIVRAMEPEDAHVLRLWGDVPRIVVNGDPAQQEIQSHLGRLGIDADSYLVAARNLDRLGCIYPVGPDSGLVYVQGLTAFGRGFLRACRVE